MAREGKNYKNGRSRVRTQIELEQRIIDLARVTRVMAGGKRLRFRVLVALGDKNGKVGWGVAKGADVTIAVNKAVNQAKKNMFKVYLINETIPHAVTAKFKAAKVLLKPAKKGTGIIAGGAVRSILKLAGIPNIYGKILGGTSNKINNVQAVFKAFKSFKKVEKMEEEIEVEAVDDEQLERDLLREEELEEEQKKLLKRDGLEEVDIKKDKIWKS